MKNPSTMNAQRKSSLVALVVLSLLIAETNGTPTSAGSASLRVGAAAVTITPFGPHPDWDGTITDSGVWGEKFTDENGNGIWDPKEKFEDDARNSELDRSSARKWDGIYIAGFGNKRIATGKHDDLWARAVVFDDGATRVAVVAIDLLGYFERGKYYGLNRVRAMIDPALKIDEIILTSTHNHEGPDPIGSWGDGYIKDGKYPMYLQFVDRQIARAVQDAAAKLAPARIKLGSTDPARSPSIVGMQTRTGGRPPQFYDEALRTMQIVRVSDDETSEPGRELTIATLVNWATHPESMEDKNTLLTSDFPHAVRKTLEDRYGGVAVYLSGALGAVEIIGDSNIKPTDRNTFDGIEFPRDPVSQRPIYSFERTMAIGRDIAKAAIQAIESAEWSVSSAITLKQKTIRVEMDNIIYKTLNGLGVLDLDFPQVGGKLMIDSPVHALSIGDAQMITVPGEVFPEVFYGSQQYGRSDCPEADTGLPREPAIAPLMRSKHKWVLGLSPNEFGYIVPLYDFRAPKVDPLSGPKQTPDACQSQGVPSHYHEIQSASSQLAPAWACAAAELLTGVPPSEPACSTR